MVAEDQMQGIRCQLCDGVKRIREHGFSGQVQQRFGPAGSGSFALAGGQQNDGFSRFMHFGWGSWRAVRSFCSGRVLLPGCASEWESFEASWRCRFQLPCAELIGVVAEDQMQGIRCQLCDGVKRIREHGFSGQVQQRFGPAGSGSFALAGGQQNDGFSRFMHFGWGSWRAVRSFCSGRVLLPGCASEWESFEASWRCRFQLPCAELIGVVAEDQMQGIRCQLCDGVKRIREHGFSGQVQQRFGPAGSGSFALAGGQQNDGFSRFMHFGWGSWRAVRSFCSGRVLPGVPVNGNLLRPAGGVVFNCRARS